MYIRYATYRIDCDSNCYEGIFCAAYRLKRNPHASDAVRDEIARQLRWFCWYLPIPNRWSHYSKKRKRRHIAICWFKPEAQRHLKRIHAMAEFLRTQEISIQVIETRLPGYITYEDTHQVAAVPFRETNLVGEEM